MRNLPEEYVIFPSRVVMFLLLLMHSLLFALAVVAVSSADISTDQSDVLRGYAGTVIVGVLVCIYGYLLWNRPRIILSQEGMRAYFPVPHREKLFKWEDVGEIRIGPGAPLMPSFNLNRKSVIVEITNLDQPSPFPHLVDSYFRIPFRGGHNLEELEGIVKAFRDRARVRTYIPK